MRTPPEEQKLLILRRSAEEHSADPTVYAELGRLYLIGSDHQDAIRSLEKAQSLGLRTGPVCFLLGCSYSLTRNWDSALREWEKFVDFDSELKFDVTTQLGRALSTQVNKIWESYANSSLEGHKIGYHLGVANFVLGRYEDAVRALDMLLKQNPASERGLNCRARCLRQLKRYEEAERDLKDRLKILPRDHQTLFSLGLISLDRGQPVRAIDYLNKSLAEKPGQLLCNLSLAQANLSLMQYEQATTALKVVLQHDPKHATALLLMGQCLEAQYLMDEAAEVYGRAVAADPDSKQANLALGMVYKNLGRQPSAIKHLQKAVELDPTESEAHYSLGVLYCALRNYPQAIRPLQRCLDLVPNHHFARYALGKACLGCEKIEEAIMCFNLALEQNPQDVKCMTALGTALFQKKQLTQARNQFERVLERNPREAEAHYYLGATCFQQNDYKKAIESYHRATQVKGDSVLDSFINAALSSYNKDYENSLRLFQKATSELRPDGEQDVGKFATLQLLATVGINHAKQGLELEGYLNQRRSLFIEFVKTLASFLDARDKYTRYHSWRVAFIGEMLARHIGLPEDVIEGIKMGGLLHDIGKIGIPEAVLNKPGKLTDEEYEQIKLHPVIGHDGLKGVQFPWPEVMPIVRHHHEKWNGRGYPDGLSGDDIALEARIIGIADFFDALTTNRPYRKAFGYGKALEIMKEECEKGGFDPDLLEEFASLTDTNDFFLLLPAPVELDVSGKAQEWGSMDELERFTRSSDQDGDSLSRSLGIPFI
jgi:putative nucleotidyltransferase with HDIG domain